VDSDLGQSYSLMSHGGSRNSRGICNGRCKKYGKVSEFHIFEFVVFLKNVCSSKELAMVWIY
jgi:hypothetical protein